MNCQLLSMISTNKTSSFVPYFITCDLCLVLLSVCSFFVLMLFCKHVRLSCVINGVMTSDSHSLRKLSFLFISSVACSRRFLATSGWQFSVTVSWSERTRSVTDRSGANFRTRATCHFVSGNDSQTPNAERWTSTHARCCSRWSPATSQIKETSLDSNTIWRDVRMPPRTQRSRTLLQNFVRIEHAPVNLLTVRV